jgi:hypothetical protein
MVLRFSPFPSNPEADVKTVYVFYPREPVQSGDRPFRFSCCSRAVRKRDELIARGLKPSTIWEHSLRPERPLQCCDAFDGRHFGKKTVRQVLRRLNRVLQREGLHGQLEYGFDPNRDYGDRQGWAGRTTWGELHRTYTHLACFAVAGANEGDYIHIEWLGWGDNGAGRRQVVALGKTFAGPAVALAIAARCAHLLGAMT